ncbi:MAG: hypothetical protein ACP5R5_04915 [Armatimonadota bacterium]
MALVLILFLAAVVIIALRAVRSLREGIERERIGAANERGNGGSEYGWIGDIHAYWYTLGLAAAGLKFVYTKWRTAPTGSWERLCWGSLLALIIALAMYAVVKLVDNKLNGRPIRGEQS